MKRDAKCRAVNSLVALADFGPVSHSTSARSQEEQNAICPPGLKEMPEKNQKELLVYCTPCSDTKGPQITPQAALERRCDIPGVAKDSSAPVSRCWSRWSRPCQAVHCRNPFPRQKRMCRAMGWPPQGCGFCQCNI